jgi:hypothetical protein
MDNNNYSQNNFSNNDYESNITNRFIHSNENSSQIAVTQASVMNDTHVPVTYGIDVNNAEQRPLFNVVAFDHSSQQYDALNNQNHQQPTSNGNNDTISPDYNHQQQYALNHNQSSTFNGISNINDTISSNHYHQQYDSHNIPRYNYQQPTPYTASSQVYPRHIGQSSPQSNNFHFNSPQTNIIIIPTTNSDVQNQLQQVYTYLNRFF